MLYATAVNARRRGSFTRQSLSPDAERALDELLGQSEGMPSAIAVLAAYADILGPVELLQRLDDPEEALSWTAGQQGEALRNELARALDGIAPPGRHLLARAAVFAGTFDCAAAHAVLGAGMARGDTPYDAAARPMLDEDLDGSLIALRDAGLLLDGHATSARVTGHGDGSPGLRIARPYRFRLWTSLPGEEQLALGKRHIVYVAGRAETLAQTANTRQRSWATRGLASLQPEIMSAAARALQMGDAEFVAHALRALAALQPLHDAGIVHPAFASWALRLIAWTDDHRLPAISIAAARCQLTYAGTRYDAEGPRVAGRAFSRVVTMAEDEAELVAFALANRAFCHYMCADYSAARSDAEEAIRRADEAEAARPCAEGLRVMAMTAIEAGELPEAIETFERAWSQYAQVDDVRGMAFIDMDVAGAHLALHDLTLSEHYFARAANALQALEDWSAYAALLQLAGLRQARGHLDTARELAERALEVVRAAGSYPMEEAKCLAMLGEARHELLDLPGALDAYRECQRLGERCGSLHLSCRATADWAAVEAMSGNAGVGRRFIERAKDLAMQDGSEILIRGVLVHEGLIMLAEASMASDRGDEEEAARLQAAAANRQCSDAPPKQGARLGFAGLAERLFDMSLQRLRRPRRDAVASASTIAFAAVSHSQIVSAIATTDLAIGKDARWFATDHGPRVSLGRRRLLRRLLQALATRHAAAPGAPLSFADLCRAGWPDAVGLPADALMNRLRVAITELRKLGLRQHLLTAADGYLLAPSVRVYSEADERIAAAAGRP